MPPTQREDPTLAQINQAEAAADPVRQLEAQLTDLRRRHGVATPTERHALDASVAQLGHDLHDARRQRTADRAFASHRTSPFDIARANRLATARYDALRHPEWLVTDVTERHTSGTLPPPASYAASPDFVHLIVEADGVRSPLPPVPAPRLRVSLP